MAAHIGDAQHGRRGQVGFLRRGEAHELRPRPVEEHLAQLRLEARVDPPRVQDDVAEVLQQPLPLLRREEPRRQERHAQEQLLVVPPAARAVYDGVDLPQEQRLVKLVGRLVHHGVGTNALLAPERRERVGVQIGVQHADLLVVERGRLVRRERRILHRVDAEDRIRSALRAQGKLRLVGPHLLRGKVHVNASLPEHLARCPLVHRHILVLPARAARDLVEVVPRIADQQPLRRVVGKVGDVETADAQQGRRLLRKQRTARHKQHEHNKKNAAAAREQTHSQHLSCDPPDESPNVQMNSEHSISDSLRFFTTKIILCYNGR